MSRYKEESNIYETSANLAYQIFVSGFWSWYRKNEWKKKIVELDLHGRGPAVFLQMK